MNPFKNYNLGQGGVNVDASPAHIALEELLQAQNAIRDPLGVEGGLKNRPGLTKFNASALAGSALGGITVPALTPIDSRVLYIAQQDGSSVEQWWTSSNLFATSTQVTAVGAWQDPTAYFANAALVSHMGAFLNGQLYYASASYTSGTTSPTIRVFNGVDDREISKLLPVTTLGITSILATKGKLYILTLDSGTTDANFVGRVFEMNPTTGVLTAVGTALATGYVPMTAVLHSGLLFVGTGRLTTTNEARIYRINPIDEAVWTLDFDADADDYIFTALASFQGQLYATTKNGGAATKGKIKKRTVAGVWSTVDSTTNNSGTYDGLTEFGGSLYASSRSYATTTTTAVIRKSADGTTWSTVYNAASTTGVGQLTPLGLRVFSMGGTGVLHSADGASWTSATPSAGGNVDGALGVLFRRGDAQFKTPIDPTDTSTSTGPVTNVINVSASAANDPSQVFLVSSVLATDAQIRAGNTTPITVVAAPGANKWIMPIYMSVASNITVAFSASGTFNTRFAGDATNITTSGTFLWNSTGKLLRSYIFQAIVTQFNDVNQLNKALQVQLSADLTLGTTSGGTRITVGYVVLDFPA